MITRIIVLAFLALLVVPLTAIGQEDVEVSFYRFAVYVDGEGNVYGDATVKFQGEDVGLFTTTNPQAYLLVELSNVPSPFILTFEWLDPDDKVFQTASLRETGDAVFSSYTAWSWIDVDKDTPKGAWTVNVYLNDKLILQTVFFLFEPQQLMDVLTAYNTLNEENQKLKEQLQDAEARVNELSGQLSEMRKKVDVLQSENSDLKSQVDKLSQDNERLKKDLQEAQSKVSSLSQENRELSQQLKTERAAASQLEMQRWIFLGTTALFLVTTVVMALRKPKVSPLPPPPPPT